MKVIAQIAKGDDEFEYIICELSWKIKDQEALFETIQKTLPKGEYVVDIFTNPRELTFHMLKPSRHIRKLIQNACKVFDVDAGMLRTRSGTPLAKKRKYTYVRNICYYIMRYRYDMHWQRIGDEFGGRNHATIIHGVNQFKAIFSDPQDDYERDYVSKCKMLLETTLYGDYKIEEHKPDESIICL